MQGAKELGCGINAARKIYVCRYKVHPELSPFLTLSFHHVDHNNSQPGSVPDLDRRVIRCRRVLRI